MRISAFVLGILLSAASATGQQMAITFDDLPAHGPKPPGMTRLAIADSILATIKRENLPVVYGFINGVRTTEDPASLAVLKAWRAAGQPLGNHTWAHLDLEDESPAEFEREIEKNEPLLKDLMAGRDWRYLRYPFLHEGETTEKRRAVRAWLKAHGYTIAEVSMDFEDYMWNEPYARCMVKGDDTAVKKLHDSYLAMAEDHYSMWRELTKKVFGRDIKYVLLLHVGAFDAKMLPELLAMYRAKGVTFVSLPEALADPAYLEDADIGYQGGGPIEELLMVKNKYKFPSVFRPAEELEKMCR